MKIDDEVLKEPTMDWANRDARILAVLRKLEQTTRQLPKTPTEAALMAAIYGICQVICERKP